MLPACVEVCPVEMPGRGAREGEIMPGTVAGLATALAATLPLRDTPYAIFGTCLGAILAYETVCAAIAIGLPPPVVLFPAACSPPHLYAVAVMKLYVEGGLRLGAEAEGFVEVNKLLAEWEHVDKEQVMMVRRSKAPAPGFIQLTAYVAPQMMPPFLGTNLA